MIIMIMKLKISGGKYWSLRLEKPHELKEKNLKMKKLKEKEKLCELKMSESRGKGTLRAPAVASRQGGARG